MIDEDKNDTKEKFCTFIFVIKIDVFIENK